MSRAVLAMGSNVGDRFYHLSSVVRALGPRLIEVSPVFENPAFGPIPQEPFLNAVAAARDDTAGPADWLHFAARMEQAAGRVRELRWGPRSLDVDVITVYHQGKQVRSDDPWLRLPHPRARERACVLLPWAHICPDDELPGYGQVSQLLAALPQPERDSMVERADLRWQL
ncbi:MAG: 2-amino-4-hydroxy-6-hydroxymethyldihydropteridine diphosphokinase [Acidimicrobiales bacterium]|nr:MAG: 2-amino-4-hydroxy-6-hydroxymethyldihydropteridine diphosphokinase [Acidimicrobiales bacterium]